MTPTLSETIVAIVGVFAALIKDLLEAGDDRDKQQDALMAAEEQLAHSRAVAKFGPA